MRTAPRPRILWMLAALLPGFLIVSPASAQYRDEYGDIRQTVARISYIDGSASFSRGDDPDNWQAADRNVPMTIGDRVYTGSRGRLELQIQGGDFVRLGPQTDLAALNLTDDTKQFSVNIGVASFQIRRLDQNDVFEIDTPNAAITVDQPGDFRVDVDRDGNTRVIVRRGRVIVAAGGGQVPLQSGDEMDIDGIDAPRYDIVAVRSFDSWDNWVRQRQYRATRARSLQYVSADVVGVDDLDDSGRWEDVPSYGRCWTPTVVAADWVPYRVGHWVWQDPWGWTWVSAEPWGWAPYHYGRWVTWSSRWYWVPVAPSVRFAAYSPALVAFVGGGPGWSASVAIGGGGFVGWFPLGPRDPFNPWWSRREVNVNVTNVTYVNKTYVTVVNQNTFVSGGVVTNAVVRDTTVIRQVAAAPVMRGPLPVVPTAGSLHVAVRADMPAAVRPPAQVARSVVARVAPPPAPPSFQDKIAVIRENHGAPVAPAEAARISVEHRGRAQAIAPVRPVAAEPGKMTLAPRGRAAESSAHPPEPMTSAPARGRAQATAQQPVSSAPVTSSGAPSREPSREIAPRSAPQQAPAPQPAPERRREHPEAAPPAEKQVAPPERIAPTQPAQPESWRNRERAPRNAPPQTEQPTPQPAEHGRQSVAPPPARPVEQPSRRRDITPIERPQTERARPEREAPQAAPQARPEPQHGRERPTPTARESRPAEERPAAAPAREARPQPQAERQVERPTPQKGEQKKKEEKQKKEAKEKEKQRTPKPE